jgi:uncharacterized repeat protein (TIGR03803 family)
MRICLRTSLCILLALLAVNLLPSTASANSWTEHVLYSFTGGADGGTPEAQLAIDKKRNLYGTTFGGGTGCNGGCGTVFKVTPSGKESVLYTFQGMPDGANPRAGVVFDKNGDLYGATSYGGKPGCNYELGCGTVFKVTPSGKEHVLYSFCRQQTCADGANPYDNLIFDGKGNLYGTTYYGGAYGFGVVFMVSASGKERTLYSFTGDMDGAYPFGGVVLDAKGNLYGTTSGGGTYGKGTVFKVSPSGQESILHSFTGGADGANPYSRLILDAKRNLYGTTFGGGGTGCNGGCGTVFKVTPSGKESVLYSFCQNYPNCADGENPVYSLIFDDQGNLYGTTFSGGTDDEGTVFELSAAQSGAWTESVLYSFQGAEDGGGPQAGLVFDAKGNLYGTTSFDGANGYGTVFRLSP